MGAVWDRHGDLAAKVSGRWGMLMDGSRCELHCIKVHVEVGRQLESGMDEDADGCRYGWMDRDGEHLMLSGDSC